MEYAGKMQSAILFLPSRYLTRVYDAKCKPACTTKATIAGYEHLLLNFKDVQLLTVQATEGVVLPPNCVAIKLLK